MRWLVVNADDGGLAAPTDAAILRCAREGIVCSATVVANGATAAAFARDASAAGLDLGLHINLTEGAALAGPQPTLTDDGGRFVGKAEVWRRAAAGELDAGSVRREVAAQWARLIDLGVRPTHVDGHNHVHLFPAVLDVMRELAKDLWVRCPRDRAPRPADLPKCLDTWAATLARAFRCTERFTGYAFATDPSAATFLESLDESARVTEFMVHPGSRPGSRFAASPQRDRETEVLCMASLDRELERQGYRLAGFGEVLCG